MLPLEKSSHSSGHDPHVPWVPAPLWLWPIIGSVIAVWPTVCGHNTGLAGSTTQDAAMADACLRWAAVHRCRLRLHRTDLAQRRAAGWRGAAELDRHGLGLLVDQPRLHSGNAPLRVYLERLPGRAVSAVTVQPAEHAPVLAAADDPRHPDRRQSCRCRNDMIHRLRHPRPRTDHQWLSLLSHCRCPRTGDVVFLPAGAVAWPAQPDPADLLAARPQRAAVHHVGHGHLDNCSSHRLCRSGSTPDPLVLPALPVHDGPAAVAG